MNNEEGLAYQTFINSLIMVITGSINSIANKFQASLGYKYGLSATFQMFFGEYLNLFALILPIAFSKTERSKHFFILRQSSVKEGKKLKVGFWRLGLGGLFDAFASSLQSIAIFFMPASIWQMMRNATIIFVVLFTVFYLKKKVLIHSRIAVIFSMIGFILVGAASTISDSKELKMFEGGELINSLIGVGLLLTSLIFSGFQFAYQEGLLDEYEFDPKRLISAESIVGTISLSLCLFASANVSCPNPKMCTDALDDPSEAMVVLLRDGRLLVWAICSTLSIMIFNLTGVLLTKNVSSVFRIVIDSIRTILIWIFSVIFGLEEFVLSRFLIQAPGFIFLIMGSLIYNEIIVFSCFGFNKDVKKNIEQSPSEALSIFD